MGKKYDGKKFLPTIGSYFKEMREKHNIAQETVSMETGIARSNIVRYEHGEVDMPISNVPVLCHLYKCSMAECGKRVDNEMSFYDTTESAVESAFKDAQAMSFSIGTPMVPVEYEVETEEQFDTLIKSVIHFRENELLRMQIPHKDKERVIHNFDFFMVEFIKTNEPDKERRERLLKLCNEALKKDTYND